MLSIALLLFSTALFNVKPAPVFADVYIAGSGPHRFLVDTGAETTLVDAALAKRLRLHPEFQVELVTSQSSRMVPGAKLSHMKLGARALPPTEVLFQDLREARQLDPKVVGVLGLNALRSFDFTLQPASGHFEDTSERPTGAVVPYEDVQGRMAVKVRMKKEILTLILDSGSSHIVLFHVPAAMAKVNPLPGTLTTIEGARGAAPTCWTAEIDVTNQLRIQTLPAAIVLAKGTQVDGLLPVSVFKKVHVDQSRHELILVR